jgi:hypothetical protein
VVYEIATFHTDKLKWFMKKTATSHAGEFKGFMKKTVTYDTDKIGGLGRQLRPTLTKLIDFKLKSICWISPLKQLT